jgi:DNA (cytosine-5)-methyltransferase 1
MRQGSLFSGIGGFDLAAEWMGWENVFHCEWNEFGQKILKHYWPNAISYGDITKTDFSIHRGKIDVLTGGFPCQPYSLAGKRKGKEDERHLWPEMLRAIREISPTYIVGENVYGLVNWNGGLVFNEVQTDLEAQGYEVIPVILPACAVNAPHRRDRVWFVAKNTRSERLCDRKIKTLGGGGREFVATSCKRTIDEKDFNTPNTNSNQRCQGGLHKEGCEKAEGHVSSCNARIIERTTWQNFPTQPPVCSGNDGLSPELDGITFSKWRTESIKAYGNAIVPQIAYQIFRFLELI